MKTIAEKVAESRHLSERIKCGGKTWTFRDLGGTWTRLMSDGNKLKVRKIYSHSHPWTAWRFHEASGTLQNMETRGFKSMENAAKAALKHWGYVS